MIHSEARTLGADDAARATAPLRQSEQINWTIPGFGPKVRIGTMFGDLPIEALRLRDDIRTNTGRVVRVQWIDKIQLDEDFIYRCPGALPTVIAANAFGMGRPMQEMVVSPRQEVCPEPHVATRFMAGADLRARFNAQRGLPGPLTYYRFHCGEPVVIKAEGVWVRIEP
jgi:hypothetical protein